MNPNFTTQQDRLLQLKTILPETSLYISDFGGEEALSQPFCFGLDIVVDKNVFGRSLKPFKTIFSFHTQIGYRNTLLF